MSDFSTVCVTLSVYKSWLVLPLRDNSKASLQVNFSIPSKPTVISHRIEFTTHQIVCVRVHPMSKKKIGVKFIHPVHYLVYIA